MDFKSEVFKELLEDDYFVQWLVAPDKASDLYWKEWIKAHPDKAPVLRDIKAVVNAIEPKHAFELDREEKDLVLGQIMQHASLHRESPASAMPKLRRRRKQTSLVFMAACVVILGLLAAQYFGVFLPEQTFQAPSTERIISKQTAQGTKSSFYLPDGTLVKLNSSSKLMFPAVFPDSIREVRLIGQAFFEVTRDESAPFIVKTEKMDIQVLGTSFDILSYPGTDRFEVAVASGRVEVSSHLGSQEIITKSEMTQLDPTTGKLLKSTFDPIYHLGWKDGILTFRQASFREVFDKLEDWYGVEITGEESLDLSQKYTGKYDNQSLENVLTGMASVLEFKFEINGKQVKIFS